MQLNSYIFIMAMMPISTIGYFLFNLLDNKLGKSSYNTIFGKAFIVACSMAFYLYWSINMALILIVSLAINLVCSLAIVRFRDYKKAILISDISINVCTLLYFKYLNFFISNINSVSGSTFELKNIILPLGISFFTFQQIMYIVNVYRGEIERINVLDYLLCILFFPKLIIGPLMEPVDLIQQFNDLSKKKVNYDNIANGIKMFSFGLFKKMLIADTFSKAVTWGYSNIDKATSMDWVFITLFYTFEIYFDFSGYSDMALGVSKMLNIDLPCNFDSPYKAISIRDFWKRWHISLTSFLTKYIYIPLGGSKKGSMRTYLNTMIVFLISGIWHGANWTFILWGVLHGLLSVIERIINVPKNIVTKIIGWFVTFSLVNVLWLLFRSDSISQWIMIIKKVVLREEMYLSDGLIDTFTLPEFDYLFGLFHIDNLASSITGFSLLGFTAVAMGICLVLDNNYKLRNINNFMFMILAAIAFVWSFICLGSESVFVYFNF